MWPRSAKAAHAYRGRLRVRECRLVMQELRRIIPALFEKKNRGSARILEFGTGSALQLPILREYGTVFASDIEIDRHLQRDQVRDCFILCDIAHAPYMDDCFDLVFSNHVIEHVKDLEGAMKELRRIGTPGCVFAFSVPTPVWLLLSLPTQYLAKALNIWARLSAKLGIGSSSTTGNRPSSSVRKNKPSSRRSLLAMFAPHGHGEYPGFWQCFFRFREREWRDFFVDQGFRVVHVTSLLLYANARWPIIPANQWLPRLGITSSRLFVLQCDK